MNLTASNTLMEKKLLKQMQYDFSLLEYFSSFPWIFYHRKVELLYIFENKFIIKIK